MNQYLLTKLPLQSPRDSSMVTSSWRAEQSLSEFLVKGDAVAIALLVAADVGPDRVGIDRLLSAYAVVRRCESPAVIVDAGSAVTVDWVDAAGCFCGGAILPGFNTSPRFRPEAISMVPKKG